jgi:hypothetical protein
MLNFSTYLIEAKKRGVDETETEIEPDSDKINRNTALGAAFETLTAMHLHNRTDSLKNKDPEHIKRMAEIAKKHKAAMAFLSPDKRAKVTKGADRAASAYLESLGKQGIKPSDISEVHHTSTGISKVLGRQVSQSQNPHDIVIKTKKRHPAAFGPHGNLHGTSLKLTQGTISNNGVGEIDKVSRDHGMNLNMSGIWNKGYKDAVGDMAKKDVKKIRHRKDVEDAYLNTRGKVLKHYENEFNNTGTNPQERLANQKKHLAYLMKSNPDMNYDYTNAEKGYSKPVTELDHVKAVNNATGFTTKTTGSMMHVYDQDGRHLLSVEHRATHGPWSSIQVNAKLGTLKAAGDKPAAKKKPHPAAGVVAPPAPAVAPAAPVQRPAAGGFGQHRGDGPRHYQAYVDRSSHMGFKDSGI